MSHQPPPPAPPPWALPPEPMSLRRKVLLALLGFVVVALIAAIVAFDSVYAGVLDRFQPEGGTTVSGAPLTECAPGNLGDRATEYLFDGPEAWYRGVDVEATAVPDAFPASAFAVSGVLPDCGFKATGPTGLVEYVFVADAMSRARFEGVSAMLTAQGLVMNLDQVSREPQVLEPGRLSGLDPALYDYLYRQWVLPEGGSAFVAFLTDDTITSSGTGELVFGYPP